MNRLFRRLSLLLCVLLLLITALSGCGTSPAAPSGPSTPQAPTAEDEALRRAPFQPVITCELAGEAETLTEEQQQAILSYTTMLCTALARPDDPLPEEPYTTDTLRQEALTRGFLWSSYIWGEQRVQVYPMNPISAARMRWRCGPLSGWRPIIPATSPRPPAIPSATALCTI